MSNKQAARTSHSITRIWLALSFTWQLIYRKNCTALLMGGLFCFTSLSAQYFNQSDRCQDAYELIMDLRFEEANSQLALAAMEQPGNRIPLLLESYMDFLQTFINERESDLLAFDLGHEERLAILESADKNDPYHAYAKAEMYLHSGIARIKFEEYWTAARHIRKAYKLLAENQQRFPDFAPNKKSLGILRAVIGTVPDGYQWALKLFGMKGNLKQGIGELDEFLRWSKSEGESFYIEAQLVRSFLAYYLLKDKSALQHSLETEKCFQKGVLGHFISAYLWFRLKENDRALEEMNQLRAGDRIDFPLWHYLKGNLLLNKMDPSCVAELHTFTTEFKGRHYIKSAHQRLAWFHHLANDSLKREQHRQSAITEGMAILESDKKALSDALSEKLPNKSLLGCGLLYDGGYYTEALQQLVESDYKKLTAVEQQEFLYRQGSCYLGLKEIERGQKAYETLLDYPAEQPLFFAPKAAIQLGVLHEKIGDLVKAEAYYLMALGFKGHEYKNSLDQQAKAGLQRIAH